MCFDDSEIDAALSSDPVLLSREVQHVKASEVDYVDRNWLSPQLNIGATYESRCWRVHLYDGSVSIRDTRNASKRGKKCPGWRVSGTSSDWQNRNRGCLNVADAAIDAAHLEVTADVMAGVLTKAAAEYKELSMYDDTDKGVDVVPTNAIDLWTPPAATGAAVTYLELLDKPRTSHGHTYAAPRAIGHRAVVTPGVSIRLYGWSGTPRVTDYVPTCETGRQLQQAAMVPGDRHAVEVFADWLQGRGELLGEALTEYLKHGDNYAMTRVQEVRDPRADVDPMLAKRWASNGLRPYDRTFKLGDTAEHGSYNRVYTGPIVSITAKTVTVRASDIGSGNKQFSIYGFDAKNWDLDLDAIAKRNADWYD